MVVNLGFHYVLVLNVDLEKWCEKYELEPFTTECLDCGEPMHVNLPFAGKDRRGLISLPCKCGNKYVPHEYIDLGYGENSLNSLGISTGSSTTQVFQEKAQTAHHSLRLVDNSRS